MKTQRNLVLAIFLALGLAGCGDGKITIDKKKVEGNVTRITVSVEGGNTSVGQVRVNDGEAACGVSGRVPAELRQGNPLSYDVGFACPGVRKVEVLIKGRWHRRHYDDVELNATPQESQHDPQAN